MFIATSTLIVIVSLAYFLGLATIPLLLLVILTSRGRLVAERTKGFTKQ